MHIAKRPDSRQGAIRLVFRGRGLDRAFLEFTADRARRLALSGWAEEGCSGEVTVVVSGPIALADALEMACMLGPLHCLVDVVERSDEPPHSVRRPGFLIRPPGG